MFRDVLMSVKCREPAVLLVCFVASDADGEVDLILVVGLRIDLADAALEDVAPSHVHEFGHLFVVDRGHIAEEIGCELCLAVHLGVFVEEDADGVLVFRVVVDALQAKQGADLEVVPYLIDIVVLTASQVALLKKHFL